MNFVQLCTYDNYLVANMQLSILKEGGITCYIKDEYTITIDPLLSPAIGGMKLMVDELQMDSAKKILEESDKTFLQTIPCPNCGRHALEHVVETKYPEGVFEKIKFMVINGQDREIKKYYRCNSCDFKFDELPVEE